MLTTQREPESSTHLLQGSYPKFCEPLLPVNKSCSFTEHDGSLNGSVLLKEKLKHIRAEKSSLGKIRLEPASSCLQSYQCTPQKVSFSPLRKLFYSLLQNSECISFCGKAHSKVKGSFPIILIVKNITWQIHGKIYNQKVIPDFYNEPHCITIFVTVIF